MASKLTWDDALEIIRHMAEQYREAATTAANPEPYNNAATTFEVLYSMMRRYETGELKPGK